MSDPPLVPPKGACDTHCHVFGPQSRFPFDPKRTYTPDDAPKEALMALHRRFGFDHAVVVQAGAHGFDNSAALDVLAASQGRYRGIALVPDDVAAADVARLHAGGMRGVRFNFMPHLGPPPSAAAFRHIAEAIAPYDWHIVLHLTPDALDLASAYLKAVKCSYVIDHMARVSAAGGVDQPGFRKLLDLMADSRAWVKISAADRASAAGAPYDDALPFMEALIAAAPDRVLWGTDWPHPNVRGPMPREEDLLALLARAAPGEAVRRRILVDNPGRLYGFS